MNKEKKENKSKFKIFVEAQVLPKLKDEKDVRMYKEMCSIIEHIGYKAYSMSPEEILESYEIYEEPFLEYEVYDTEDWIEFLSNDSISKFLDNFTVRMNATKLRSLINDISTKDNISIADVRVLDTLKKIVDDSKKVMDDTVQHYSQFYPLRARGNIEYSAEEASYINKELLEVMEHLYVDTDYMDIIDVQEHKKKMKELEEIAKESKKHKEEMKKAKAAKAIIKAEKDRARAAEIERVRKAKENA